jgi:hypothetical protein
MIDNVTVTNLDLFPIPFSVFNLGEQTRETNKKLLDCIYDEKKNYPISPERSNIGGWQQTTDLKETYKDVNDFAQYVLSLAKQNLSRIGYTGNLDEQVKMGPVWANITDNPSSVHLPHIHGFGDTILSIVYYPSSGFQDGVSISESQNLNDPPNIYAAQRPNPGDIQFQDPAYISKRQVFNNKVKRYPYYCLEMCVTPREGLLIMFPNYLPHLVTPTCKPGFTRISMTFDIQLTEKR